MHLHEPNGYRCPFCAIVQGSEDPRATVWRDEVCVAVIARHQKPKSKGALLVFPVAHFENIYVLPDEIGAHIFKVSKRLAIALRTALACDGISTRQHNEPAGNQEVWHYHLHVAPRFANDNFYAATNEFMEVEDRLPYATSLRSALARDAR